MDEQLVFLDTIKAKAVQAAQDGQTTETVVPYKTILFALWNRLIT